MQGKVIRALNPISIRFATLFHFNNFFTAHGDAAFPSKFICTFICTYIFLSVAFWCFFFKKFKHSVFGIAANRAASKSKNGHTWIIGKVRIRDCYRIKDFKKKVK